MESKDLGIYDIAIMGLGVAGSNLGALLKPNLKVIGIDKKDLRGDCFDEGFHKPCGGLLSQGGQRLWQSKGLPSLTHFWSIRRFLPLIPLILAILTPHIYIKAM